MFTVNDGQHFTGRVGREAVSTVSAVSDATVKTAETASSETPIPKLCTRQAAG
jgi:hypothetical protein